MKRLTTLRNFVLALFMATGGSDICGASIVDAQATQAVSQASAMDKVFRNAVGRYPFDVKLLTNKTLKDRMIKLMGLQRYKTLVEYFQVETPVEFFDGAYVAFACQAHNCGFTEFEILYFPDEDNLCIRYRIDDVESVFMDQEKYVTWPKKL